MVAEEVTVCLSGGAPWGFRLQGGAEHQKPLQVAKVRRRSKACRAGLKEDDELVAIEEQPCTELSHAQAMNLIDMQSSTLHLKVKRGSSLSPLSPPAMSLPPSWGPRCITSPPDSEAYYGETDSDADTQTPTLHRMRPRRTPPHPRSPARHDSQEADTETSEMSGYESAPDGGVSLQEHTAWEQGPHHAALTNGTSLLPGVPRREVVYQPPQNHEEEWGVASSSAHTPHTLTPTPGDQAGALLLPGEGEGEEHDSGFQEAGAYVVASAVPLVSPERANEARMLGSASQLVPMVGPQHGPVSDELSTTYREKARQAKLQRGESVVEKQVKEARTKCRSIASLLTDAPNPNSKGVLMFKKRRQRAKKYTLTCFGKAEGLDAGTETEGETGTETEEEGGSSFLSGSEVDEDGFSAGFDSTWDTGYLETLDRRSSACPSSSTPATPTTNHGLGLDTSSSSAYQSPGFAHLSPGSEYAVGVDGSSWAHPGLRSSEATTNGWYQPVGAAGPYCNNNPAPMSPPAMSLYNGGSAVAVARANVVLSPPASTAPPEHSEPHQNHYPGPANPAAMNPDSDYPGSNLNRTARPFTPGPAGLSRSSVAPVLFRPPQPRPASAAAGGVTAATGRPAAAVSMVNMTPPPRQQQPQESRRAVSSASLYISPRNGHGGSSVYSPPASLASAPSFSHPPANNNPFTSEQRAVQAAPFSPPPPPPHAQPLSPTAQGPPAYPSSAQAFTPHPPASSGMYAPPAPPPSQPPAAPAQAYAPAPQEAYAPAPAQAYAPAPQEAYAPAPQQAYAPAPQQAYAPAPQQAYAPAPQPGPSHPPPPQLFNPYTNMAAPPPANQQPPPTAASSDLLASREQRVSVPAARTGILAEARRRSQQKKPMFCSVQNKDISPNPALLSMLQNMDRDSPPPTCPASFANVNGHNNGLNNANNASEAGHDSGPEDDWLRLGAEACNFMQAQKGPRPPPVAPKPHQAPQPAPPPPPQLGGKGGQLFARRQSRMDRYERSPSVASVAAPYSPAQPRDASPTPSLPGAWKYNSTCRAPPPINYNPLLSPSCPLKAQKTPQKATAAAKAAPGKGKGKNGGISAVDIMSHQPYQLNASLFTYGGGVPQNTAAPSQAAPGAKTARVREVRRFSTPPPASTGPSLKVIAPRSATTLGEPLWRSNDDDDSHGHPAPAPAPAPYQAYQPQVSAAAPYQPQPQPQWGPAASTPLSPPPPAPTAPLPQLPTFSYPGPPTFTHLQQATDARQFKSSPDLSPPVLNSAPSSRPGSSMGVPRVPRPRFSTSNLGLQPCVWRPGSNMN